MQGEEEKGCFTYLPPTGLVGSARMEVITGTSTRHLASSTCLCLCCILFVRSLAGPLSMTYVEKYVGYWVAFLLPTVMFCFCPIVMWVCRQKYHSPPPTGSVLQNALKIWFLAQKGKWSWNLIETRKRFKSPAFWNDVKPSKLEREGRRPWMRKDEPPCATTVSRRLLPPPLPLVLETSQ